MLEGHRKLKLVDEVSDGLEAVRRAGELKPDLILLDICLPNLNGIEAATRIHQIVPGAKTVFVSMNNDADLAEAALNNGAKGYVLKANAGSELLPAIAAVFLGRQ